MNRQQIKMLGIGALLGATVIAGVAFDKDGKDGPVEVTEEGRLQYKWYPVSLPRNMSFAGEKVPLDRWEIRERLDRELLMNYYMHGSTLYILKLSSRVFPAIEKQLKENGLPDDFKYLCVAESSLQNPTSPAGAVGYWQFMRETGTRYGLEITDEIDERYHLEKSTNAACRYLKDAYGKFGNWTAAAASYNCGMGGFSNQSTFQMAGNYYDLLLPEETNRYVFRILALKQLISNAPKYGFVVPESDGYQPVPTRSMTITQSVANLAQFAIDQGTTYKMLKILNPWLRDRKLTVKEGKSYTIQLPAGK
ncbi:lytic transglycosylase domain-containing protein [Taibaiella chishuiensis]|uniref:Transglycosylase-like protein with SLT domain n=1 Tax=Taibaiella chishuiensis TaxID=1434707 RepID=A0A2P8D691_9BACT|nr:lytic transglycosylase domain-containing protein [Taibaiella chishuiensis]PSK92746.1 transglycosylase-like protein with SLT domain [Taibaiella chishuiensis]